MDKSFLAGKSNYPFKPGSFIKFYIKGLSYRFRSLIWLDLLFKHTEKLNVPPLIKGKKGNVVVTCVKDDRGSVFLIFIEVPLKCLDVFYYVEEHPDRAKACVVVKYLSDIVPTDDLLVVIVSETFFLICEIYAKKK